MSKQNAGKRPGTAPATQRGIEPRPDWEGPLEGKPSAKPWKGPLGDSPAALPQPPKRYKGKKTLENQPEVMPKPHRMNNQLTEHFRQITKRLFVNMSEQQREAYLAEGARIDAEALAARRFEAKSRAQPDRPLLYSERPPGMKFEEFMRHEYRDKGLLTDTFTLKTLRQIDLALARVYYKQLARADIPKDITIAKSRNRLNYRQRNARAHGGPAPE